jgi:ribosomal-protein-alanine N-acetyltransferase
VASGVEGIAERRTARLVLRRPRDADLAWLTGLHSDPDNYAHSPGGAHHPARARALAEASLAGWDRHGIGYWVVERDGEPVGMAGVTPMRFHNRGCFNLYYRFVAAARGQGLAAESGRESLAVAAVVDQARPVVVRTRPGNRPARRLAETLELQPRPELEDASGFVVYVSAAW